MGMDLYGKKPLNEKGEYFRRNVWGWHPLATFVIDKEPEIAQSCEHWHTNDGDGLDGTASLRLAIRLVQRIEDGSAAEYVAARDKRLAEMPDIECDICNGTGRRMWDNGWRECNGCAGKGKKRPFETWYRLDVEDIREFSVFLSACGGFQIY